MEETKRLKVKETKRQRDKERKRQRDKETKRGRDGGRILALKAKTPLLLTC